MGTALPVTHSWTRVFLTELGQTSALTQLADYALSSSGGFQIMKSKQEQLTAILSDHDIGPTPTHSSLLPSVSGDRLGVSLAK